MKTKLVRPLFAFALVSLLLFSTHSNATAQSPISVKLAYSVWVGYGPLFIAQDKGYFKDAGLDVTLTDVEDPKDRFVALAGNQLDGLVTTLDTMSQFWTTQVPFHAFLGLDTSSGGDGIVANTGITSVADLKGKNVGVNVGSVSNFLLEYALEQNGLTGKDVNIINIAQGDIPAALAANRIDAGVTWEPHLTAAVKNGAKLILSSKETPNLIVDIMLLRDDYMKTNPTVEAALVTAWNKAIDYWKANPDDADTIMAKGLGSFYKTADDIKADLAGATLYDAAANQQLFTGTDKGSAYASLKFAIDFYTKNGVITSPVKPEDMLDPSIVAPAGMATMEATSAQ